MDSDKDLDNLVPFDEALNERLWEGYEINQDPDKGADTPQCVTCEHFVHLDGKLLQGVWGHCYNGEGKFLEMRRWEHDGCDQHMVREIKKISKNS